MKHKRPNLDDLHRSDRWKDSDLAFQIKVEPVVEECKPDPMEQEEKKAEVKSEMKDEEERPSTPATQSSPAAGQSKRKSKQENYSVSETLTSEGLDYLFERQRRVFSIFFSVLSLLDSSILWFWPKCLIFNIRNWFHWAK